MSNEIELLGAGIVKPNVLKTAGLAPNERKGLACKVGISRQKRKTELDLQFF